MKKLTLFLSFGLLLSCAEKSAEVEVATYQDYETIELPLKKVKGYGTFSTPFSFIPWGNHSPTSSWGKTMVSVAGIPEDWKNACVQQIWFDARQFVYQNYKGGTITEERFNDLTEAWNIDLSSRAFSDSAIKCFTHIVMHKNEDGSVEYKLDTDNDRDFSNNETFTAYLMEDWSKVDSLVQNPHHLQYETYHHKVVEPAEIDILIVQNISSNLMYNFPSYSEVELLDKTIQITSGFECMYESQCGLRIADTANNTNTENIEKNEYLRVDSLILQNLGVNVDNQTLMLRKMPSDTVLFSTQVGLYAKPFEVMKFRNAEKVSLSDYSGKYLYLEFWGTWCAPCVEEIPNLKTAYSSIDTSKIQFLGIARNDSAPLQDMIAEKGINWPQVQISREKGIIDDYGITGYPTSFLIDGDGVIVAKNLRGENLLDTLNHYLAPGLE
jgi:thiol-disulfide isomerase/thioredoxin